MSAIVLLAARTQYCPSVGTSGGRQMQKEWAWPHQYYWLIGCCSAPNRAGWFDVALSPSKHAGLRYIAIGPLPMPLGRWLQVARKQRCC